MYLLTLQYVQHKMQIYLKIKHLIKGAPTISLTFSDIDFVKLPDIAIFNPITVTFILTT